MNYRIMIRLVAAAEGQGLSSPGDVCFVTYLFRKRRSGSETCRDSQERCAQCTNAKKLRKKQRPALTQDSMTHCVDRPTDRQLYRQTDS